MLERLKGYHDHLYANAQMLGVSIFKWEDVYDKCIHIVSLINDRELEDLLDVQIEANIEIELKCIYRELNIASKKAGSLISKLLGSSYKMSSLMTYEQWWRNKQLNKIV
jgi:hypothetical protein